MVGVAVGYVVATTASVAVGVSALNLAQIGLTVALWPDPWARLFTQDAAVLEHARQYLRIVGPVFPLFGVGLTLYFASQGAGRVLGPVLASAVRLAVVVGASWVLAGIQPTPETLFLLVAGAMAAYGILTGMSVKITDWQRA